jgi:hypothetical protein
MSFKTPDSAQVNAIVNAYPWCDHLMAETLLIMSAKGTLESFFNTMTKEATPPTSGVLVGAITVEENSPTLEETPS